MHGNYWWGFATGPSVAVIVITAMIVSSGIAWWIATRRPKRAEAAGLSDVQRDTLSDFESQVTALLVQRGGEADQTAIVAALGLPAELVAEKLLELEQAGAIQRRWSVDRMTYSIKRSAA